MAETQTTETRDGTGSGEFSSAGVETTPSGSAAPLPAPPRVNPFGPPDRPAVPPCFDSVAHQLPPQVLGKLREIDVSTAQVVILTPRGRKSEPMPMLWFVEDFAQEAAEAVGAYGLLRVAVYEPNKPAWFFGLKVEAPDGVEAGGRDDWREVLRTMQEQQQRFMETVKMELMLAGGRAPQQAVDVEAAIDREFQRMERYAAMFRQVNAGSDPAALIERSMDGVVKVFDGVGRVREKAEQFAGAGKAEPDPVDQIERVTKIPLVERGLEAVFARALSARPEAVKAGGTTAAPPTVNPFKKATA